MMHSLTPSSAGAIAQGITLHVANLRRDTPDTTYALDKWHAATSPRENEIADAIAALLAFVADNPGSAPDLFVADILTAINA